MRITIEKWNEHCGEMPSSLVLKLIAICKNIKEWLYDSQSKTSDAANRLDNNAPGLSAVIFSNNFDRLISYFSSTYLAEGTNIPDVSEMYDVSDTIKNSDSDPSEKSSLTKAASHNSSASDGVWYTNDQYNQEFYTAVERQQNSYDDVDHHFYITFEDHPNDPPPTLAVGDEEALFLKNVNEEIKGPNASQINYGEVDCANHVSQEDVNIFNAVIPFVVASNTVQDMYDEQALVAVHQGNNTASITSSLTPRKPRHTNRGQGRGSNSFGKGGFGRGQPSSQGRSLSGRGRFSGGKGKGRRNNPSTGKLTSTSYMATHPVKLSMSMKF